MSVDYRTIERHNAQNSHTKVMLVDALGGKEVFVPFVLENLFDLHFLVIERGRADLVLPFVRGGDVDGLRRAMVNWMTSSDITGV